jgi:hypothetical protein
MAATFVVNGVVCDTRDHKCFDISVPETDAVASHTHLLYATGGMGPLDSGTPIIWHQDITTAATAPHATGEIGIRVDPALSTTGFIVTKMSIAHAGGASHTYRVYVMTKPAGGV